MHIIVSVKLALIEFNCRKITMDRFFFILLGLNPHISRLQICLHIYLNTNSYPIHIHIDDSTARLHHRRYVKLTA